MKNEMINFEWHRRALDSIHGGALTNSKRAESFVKGVYPTHFASGNGCYLYTPEGKKYIDMIAALGTNLFGYNNQQINTAVIKQMAKGSVLSFGTTIEVEAAELAKDIFPWINKVRFLKTGTEACLAALRIARAHTGKSLILSDGYHGWSDEFVSLTPPANGIYLKHDILPLKGNENLIGRAAAVIVEPVVTEFNEERVIYLNNLREETKKHGTLLIFDEIITAFRWPKFSVSNDVGVFPDIICVGKCMAGGLPLSMVGTARDVGENKDWFVSGTFYGDTYALAAFKEAVTLLKNTYKIEQLWRQGEYFKNEFNKIWPDGVRMDGYPTRGIFTAKDDLTKALFFQESCRAGILVGASWFINFKHIDLMEMMLNSFKDILFKIKNNKLELDGEMPKKPFAQTQREQK
jgi:glutamate-1-semialdehyde 2,1-aminomutase